MTDFITLPSGLILRDGALFKSKGSKVVRRFTLLTHEDNYGSTFSKDKQTGEITKVHGTALVSGEANWVRADRVVLVEDPEPQPEPVQEDTADTTEGTNTMDTATVANRLNMTPKAFRRWLRHSQWPKTDGRYIFTEADFEKIADLVSVKTEAQQPTEEVKGLDSKGLATESLTTYWSDPANRAQHRAVYAARRARLMDRLKTVQSA